MGLADSQADLQPGAQVQAPETRPSRRANGASASLRAHAGDGEFSMLRTLIADLPRTRTPWEQVLRTQLARRLSQRPDLSWSRPSRSYLANQGRAGAHRRCPSSRGSAFEVGAAAGGDGRRVGLDRRRADGALRARDRGITRRLEAALTLVIGDERVQRVEHFEPGRASCATSPFQGGGGTDFTPLLEEADRHDPDITVVLTDLDGPARTARAGRCCGPCPKRKLVLA
jgi:hypothetical protein